jgi:hypothetical protein
LNPKHLTFDIVEAIDKLYEHTIENINSHNPVSSLISPEWYYSDGLQIHNGIKIDWENLEKLGLVKGMVKSLEKTTGQDEAEIVGAEFERSFCSWYQPYHYVPRQKWGVHMLKQEPQTASD